MLDNTIHNLSKQNVYYMCFIRVIMTEKQLCKVVLFQKSIPLMWVIINNPEKYG